MGDHSNGNGRELRDARGVIPSFGPMQRDDQGRAIPITDEEQRARAEALRRVFALWATEPEEEDDPPGTWEEVMRSIDAGRPEGSKKFEGLY